MGARAHSRPRLNEKCEILHPMNFEKYKFEIPLSLYPKLLKSLKSLKCRIECSQTGSEPALPPFPEHCHVLGRTYRARKDPGCPLDTPLIVGGHHIHRGNPPK